MSTEIQAPVQALQIKVFNGGDAHDGFGVNSTLVFGAQEAVLIDAQFTLANAHRLVAEILELGRSLRQIYISHMHPDHFLGLSVVHEAFPQAAVVALPEVADMINRAYAFKIDYWGKTVLGVNGSKTTVPVTGLAESSILLEGRQLEILGPFRGDADLCTAVWIPSIKTLVATDTVFNQAHVWVADAKTPAMRRQWLEVLDELQSLGAEVVVPGHAPSADYLSPDGIDFTRDYLRAFMEELDTAADGQSLIEAMSARYPNLATRICLEYSARILKDRYRWSGEWPAELSAIEPS